MSKRNYVCVYCGNKLFDIPLPKKPTKCSCGKNNSWFDLSEPRQKQKYEQIKELELKSQFIDR